MATPPQPVSLWGTRELPPPTPPEAWGPSFDWTYTPVAVSPHDLAQAVGRQEPIRRATWTPTTNGWQWMPDEEQQTTFYTIRSDGQVVQVTPQPEPDPLPPPLTDEQRAALRAEADRVVDAIRASLHVRRQRPEPPTELPEFPKGKGIHIPMW